MKCFWQRLFLWSCLALLSIVHRPVFAQLANNGIGNGGVGTSRTANNIGGQQGGGSQADFDTLIELIESTVDPDTWEEVGGPGAIDGFPGGVYVDPGGILQRKKVTAKVAALPGAALVADSLPRRASQADQPDLATEMAGLRKISLPRLEKAIATRIQAGQPPTKEMCLLAGLSRVEFVLVYPHSGDVVLAGPVRQRDGEAPVRLEDLALTLHTCLNGGDPFGCSIDPKQANLRRTQQFLNKTAQRSLAAGERPRWLKKIGELMGTQDVSVFGMEPDTLTAKAVINADYHMKLIGMGLEPGVTGVVSYLDLVEPGPNNQLPPMEVLRWWFALDYEAIETNPRETVYRLVGTGVKVLSENEMLADMGRRVPTGNSQPTNRRFAESFTRHFDQIATRYPLYQRLRNIFDLAIVAAIIKSDRLAERTGWTPGLLSRCRSQPGTSRARAQGSRYRDQ